ncbi:gastrin-releasing peptide isoform X2 [Denticeps clupeoides]|uniref:gastrin-releasing peptide isoform X2 n=1 Tax=Denticeps clupeoides TaxID=299321 RepID=UPI0010A45E3E|nr:gastrin-releasing peptide isoform X2 [Denticeps clupeoides]
MRTVRSCALLSLLSLLPLVAALLVALGDEAQTAPLHPRTNHWAVGHLMGKKSIEAQLETRDTAHHLSSLEGDRLLERMLLLSPGLRALFSPVQMPRREASEGQSVMQSVPRKRMQWEEQQEDDRELGEVTDLLIQALRMQESGSS